MQFQVAFTTFFNLNWRHITKKDCDMPLVWLDFQKLFGFNNMYF